MKEGKEKEEKQAKKKEQKPNPILKLSLEDNFH